MKKVWIGIGIGAFVVLVSLMIYFQLYIYHYNKGNDAYENGDYESAIEAYEDALACHVPDKKECDIRVNLALAMIAPIDLENLSESEVDDTIALLKEARDVLTEDGCAHMDDEDGHDADAQTLKDEIDEYIEQLENPQSTELSQDPNQNQDPDKPDEKEDEKEENMDELQEIMQQGTGEHSQGMQYQDMYNNLDYDSFYYDGNCW